MTVLRAPERTGVPGSTLVAPLTAVVTVPAVVVCVAAPVGLVRWTVVVPHLALCAWLAVVDARGRRLPNGQVLAAGVSVWLVALAGAARFGDPSVLARAALGMAAYGGLLLVVHLLSPSSLGFGDVKFAMVWERRWASSAPAWSWWPGSSRWASRRWAPG